MFKQLLIASRFGNLLIIGLAQWVSLSAFTPYNNQSKWLIIAATASIALAGYIINDKFDIEIDKVNRPEKNLFQLPIIKKWGLIIYVFLNAIALIVGFFLDYRLLVLFVSTEILLLVYSWYLKKVAIVGNLLAAALQAAVFVPCFLLVDHSTSIQPGIHFSTGEFNSWFLYIITAFAFITSFFREWVKDIEDIEGDKKFGLKTSAILFGEMFNKNALKVVALILIVLVLIFTVSLFRSDYQNTGVLSYYYLFLILPVSIRSLIMIVKLKEHEEWTKLSQWLKMLMLAGVLSIGIL